MYLVRVGLEAEALSFVLVCVEWQRKIIVFVLGLSN